MKIASQYAGALGSLTLSLLALPVYSADIDTYLNLKTGVAVSPVYQGAKDYAAQPIIGIEVGIGVQDWGQASASESGLAWQLPLAEPFSIRLLVGYDAGRDELIRTLSGRNYRLQGMGDLQGAVMAGAELSYNIDIYRFYINGMRTLKQRRYGGEDIGYTTYADLGAEANYPLTERLSASLGLATGWSDSSAMRAHFGVTQQQAQRSRFTQYRPSAGLKELNSQLALNYQFTSAWAAQSGVGGYYLIGDAADSPLTERRAGGMAFVSARYSF